MVIQKFLTKTVSFKKLELNFHGYFVISSPDASVDFFVLAAHCIAECLVLQCSRCVT